MELLYKWIWIFFIYSFLGWIAEVIYVAADQGKFVNRGFLNGPVCPIYGVGAVCVILVLEPLKEYYLLLYIGSVFLASLIEYLTGFLLEKLFHSKWWDYSDQPFHIHGYICLKFSLLWGLACVFIVCLVHPTVKKLVGYLTHPLGIILFILFLVIFVIDLCDTVMTLLKLDRRLRAMEEISQKIRKISDEIGENVAGGTLAAMEKGAAMKEKSEERNAELRAGISEYKDALRTEMQSKKEEYTRMVEKYESMIREKTRADRLLRAFPSSKSERYKMSLDKLKEILREKSQKQKAKKE